MSMFFATSNKRKKDLLWKRHCRYWVIFLYSVFLSSSRLIQGWFLCIKWLMHQLCMAGWGGDGKGKGRNKFRHWTGLPWREIKVWISDTCSVLSQEPLPWHNQAKFHILADILLWKWGKLSFLMISVDFKFPFTVFKHDLSIFRFRESIPVSGTEVQHL